MKYICPVCQRAYEEMTVDGMCLRPECWGEELVEYTGQDIRNT